MNTPDRYRAMGASSLRVYEGLQIEIANLERLADKLPQQATSSRLALGIQRNILREEAETAASSAKQYFQLADALAALPPDLRVVQ